MPQAKKPSAKPAAETPAAKPAAKSPAHAKPKTASRPRIDAVIRHIKAGNYDDDMSMLQGAIADRQRKRQEAVLGLVRETFGEDFVVAPRDAPRTIAPIVQPTDGPDEIDWKAAEEAARANEQALAKDALGPTDDDLGPDHESRSPLIGSIPDQPVEEPVAEPNPEEPVKKNPFLK